MRFTYEILRHGGYAGCIGLGKVVGLGIASDPSAMGARRRDDGDETDRVEEAVDVSLRS